MKKRITILLTLLASCVVAMAQVEKADTISAAARTERADTTIKLTEKTMFALDAGLIFDNYGRLDDSQDIYNTEYAGFRITPEWIFRGHWGLKVDVSASWAFITNTMGVWEKPMHDIANVGLTVGSFYQFRIQRWFIDIGWNVGCRVRLPYMNGEMSRYLMTFSVDVGANFRFGYMFDGHWGMYVGARADRTVYDLLMDIYYPKQKYTAGELGALLGVVYRF